MKLSKIRILIHHGSCSGGHERGLSAVVGGDPTTFSFIRDSFNHF
jgi:hypothetical protein